MSIAGTPTMFANPIRVRPNKRPDPAQLKLLGLAAKQSSLLNFSHHKGQPRGRDLDVAWDCVAAGWLTAPQEPVKADSEVRVWLFTLTPAGERAYKAELETFG